MDEIGQDPKLNVRFARGRWLDVAVAVALIAAAVLAVMTGRGSRRGPPLPTAGPGTAATPALLPHQPCGHGSRCRSASPAA